MVWENNKFNSLGYSLGFLAQQHKLFVLRDYKSKCILQGYAKIDPTAIPGIKEGKLFCNKEAKKNEPLSRFFAFLRGNLKLVFFQQDGRSFCFKRNEAGGWKGGFGEGRLEEEGGESSSPSKITDTKNRKIKLIQILKPTAGSPVRWPPPVLHVLKIGVKFRGQEGFSENLVLTNKNFIKCFLKIGPLQSEIKRNEIKDGRSNLLLRTQASKAGTLAGAQTQTPP